MGSAVACIPGDSAEEVSASEPTVSSSAVEPASAPDVPTATPEPVEPESGDEQPDTDEPADQSSAPVLTTPCFFTGPELVLPDSYIAADVTGASDGTNCLFILQAEGLADTTVIAGERFISSSGLGFEGAVQLLEDGLSIGREPDILALQRMNTRPTGRELTVIGRIDLTAPNQATIFKHVSDRRNNFIALSGVVAAPANDDGSTSAVLLWGLSNEINDQLIIDLVTSMVFTP